jgi:hypothetical protein
MTVTDETLFSSVGVSRTIYVIPAQAGIQNFRSSKPFSGECIYGIKIDTEDKVFVGAGFDLSFYL